MNFLIIILKWWTKFGDLTTDKLTMALASAQLA
jgi:hypothetical protein